MGHHGLKIPGPAHIKFNSPDALGQSTVKGCECIFINTVMLSCSPRWETILQALNVYPAQANAGAEHKDEINALKQYFFNSGGKFHIYTTHLVISVIMLIVWKYF